MQQELTEGKQLPRKTLVLHFLSKMKKKKTYLLTECMFSDTTSNRLAGLTQFRWRRSSHVWHVKEWLKLKACQSHSP